MSFMALEPLLVSRLLPIAAPFGAQVLTASDIGDATEDSLPMPSLRLVNAGYAIERDGGPIIHIEHTVLVIVAVRHVAHIRSGEGARAKAGPMMDAVWDALIDFRPAPPFSRLIPQTPPSPLYRGGAGYYPMAFSSRFKRMPPCGSP
jgi:hypothetical protein